MTLEEKVDNGLQRLAKCEAKTESNTEKINAHEESLKNYNTLILSINNLAIETKYMREDLNASIERITRLESKDCEAANKEGEKWGKFKWIIVAVLVSLIAGYIFGSLGLK